VKPRTRLLPRARYHRDARLFVVATEGQETEPGYFRALEARELIPATRVRLLVLPAEEGRSAVKHLVDRVAKCLDREPFETGFDQVWLVLDTDLGIGNRVEQLRGLVQDCESSGWRLAISHPSFEVWLLLHVTDDVGAVDDTCASVVRCLQSHLGGYHKSHPPPACLDRAALATAIERARTLDTTPMAPWPTTPASRMYRLLVELRQGM